MRIFGFVGKKQSGKNTCVNIVHGMVLRKMGLITDYKISETGKLLISSPTAMGGELVEFDITRRDAEFAEYAESTFWPYVKCYSFADTLKDIAVHLFNVPPECVYGTDEQKNTPQEHLRWENMPGILTDDRFEDVLFKEQARIVNGKKLPEYKSPIFNTSYHPNGPMTARQFLQFLGTDIMRRMWEPVWIRDTLNRIISDDSEIALIGDVRFPNESEAIHNTPGNLLKLPRSIFSDSHASETSVDDIDESLFNRILGDGTLAELQTEIEMLFTPIVNELPIIEG